MLNEVKINSPFIPSIKLKAFVTPAKQIIKKKKIKEWLFWNIWDKKGISIEGKSELISRTKQKHERKIEKSLKDGKTLLKISSKRANVNIGMKHISINLISSEPS